MRNVVEVFTYGVITDWFYIKKKKKKRQTLCTRPCLLNILAHVVVELS